MRQRRPLPLKPHPEWDEWRRKHGIGNPISPSEQRVLHALIEVQDATGVERMPSLELSGICGCAWRTTKAYLSSLEKRGVVCRPAGARRGWSAVFATSDFALM